MTEKTPNKYLLNMEKQFANENPILRKAAKLFQELDQIEFDLGLLEVGETTACKQSWWPTISLIGGNSTAKSRFINSYLGSDQLLSGIQTASNKFTVLVHSGQTTPVILPASALDVDPRYPFYQISRKIEQQQEGEGSRINSYLELKTYNTESIKGKLFIDAPNVMTVTMTPVISLLFKQTIEQSDLVLVFTDAFEQETPLVTELIQTIIAHQDNNKFIYLIDESASLNNSENISLWQRKLAAFGLTTGQFIVLPNQQATAQVQLARNFFELDQRLVNVGYDRTYRILDALEKNIHELEVVVMPEVRSGIEQWKERVNMTSMMVLGFIGSLAIFAEVQFGILELLIDPIIGPIILILLLLVMLPVHVLGCKLQARLIAKKLKARQDQLCLLESLAGIFEKNQTLLRMVLPISEPLGWNKKTKAKLAQLSDQTKQLVQSLTDHFSTFHDPNPPQDIDQENQTAYP